MQKPYNEISIICWCWLKVAGTLSVCVSDTQISQQVSHRQGGERKRGAEFYAPPHPPSHPCVTYIRYTEFEKQKNLY